MPWNEEHILQGLDKKKKQKKTRNYNKTSLWTKKKKQKKARNYNKTSLWS